MSRFGNKKREAFLSNIPTASLDSKSDLLTVRCKFNFHYMDFSQKAGQKFEDWKHSQLANLLNKLKEYSNEPLSYWQSQRAGSGNNHVFEVYGYFPKKSDFKHPKHVPHQAMWARFRLGDHLRLIGFVIPKGYDKTKNEKTGFYFDCNTFYVVFLDANHRFYLSAKR